MFLLEGLTRWNEDRAKAAAGAEGAGCYSGQEQYTLQQLTQQLFQITLVECYVKPLPYTGDASDSDASGRFLCGASPLQRTPSPAEEQLGY